MSEFALGLLSEVGTGMRMPLLLMIDQGDELFTLRIDQRTDEASAEFFDVLASFCGERSWIQILMSMRTEFYGHFDADCEKDRARAASSLKCNTSSPKVCT
jgi:hypothetical protein